MRVCATRLDSSRQLQLIEMEVYNTSEPPVEITDFSVVNGKVHYSYVCGKAFEKVYAAIYAEDGSLVYAAENKDDSCVDLEAAKITERQARSMRPVCGELAERPEEVIHNPRIQSLHT